MKTAMQEMIQNIIDIESKTYNQEQLYMLTSLKVSALILLEKEKEQIVDAYTEGYSNYDSEMTSEEYYNQYDNKKQINK
jgi:hypothetical protein